MKYVGRTNEKFEVLHITDKNCKELKDFQTNELSLVWFESDDNELNIDGIDYNFSTNQIICLTEFHKIKINHVHKLRLIRFNKPFYCILDHDTEVGCKGILYYGSSHLPIIQPNETDLDVLETVWKMLKIEMVSKDELQLEMLQMMLKRLIILCTRIYKNQIDYQKLDKPEVDIVRDFNFLVEQHFKEKHSVSEYASLLNKSPKTISNLFKTLDTKTPLQFIKDRLMLEARRQLSYTDIPVKELAYELGYADIQAFSRFFKGQQGISPSEFRQKS